MALYNEPLDEFARFDAELIGISVDGAWCHLAFTHDRKLRFPLLSDFEPKGRVARLYGVYREQEGVTERALFVIDAAGVIRWSYVSPVGVNPGADGILRALETLKPEAHMADDDSSVLTLPVGPRDHAEGPADAPVTLVEYGDYECPHCGRAYPIVKEVQRRIGPRLRFVFRNFPLSESHPHAQHAAEAAEGAGAHGRFWEMHDALFEHQRALLDRHLVEYAAAVGLDPNVFEEELRAHAHKARVREDFMSGIRSGVNGTPTFFINGQRFDDSWDPDTLTEALIAAAPQN